MLRRADFQRVYDCGRRFNSPLLTAFAAPNPGPASRVGFTTPRALGKAVSRNRIRRRVREAVRLHLPELICDGNAGWDVVINPKRAALEAGFPEIAAAVRRLFADLRKQG